MSKGNETKPADAVIPDNVRPQRGKKDTKRWCRGKVGRWHTPEMVRHHYYTAPLFADKECRWQDWLGRPKWTCYHATRCSTCGKYLQTWLKPEQCPGYTEEA